MPYTSREHFTARVLRSESNTPAGIGFIVADRHIVTCAHVVNAALSRGLNNQVIPGSEELVRVDFPILGDAASGVERNCQVVAWEPPTATGISGGGVAGLLLVDGTLPPRAGPARLVDPGAAREAHVAVFGYPQYPEARPEGGWVRLRVVGTVGGGLLQLDAAGDAAFRAQQGYSGSPVVATDAAGDAVIGIFSAASPGEQDRDSYAIPASALTRAWPDAVRLLDELGPGRYGDPYGFSTMYRVAVSASVRELPLAPQDFSGRTEEIQRLTEWLTADRGPRLVNIYGIPGSGKTALALRVAQDIGAEYPDCQLHFNLRSSDQSPVSIDTLLGQKLVQLGVPISEMPTGLEARAEAYRSRIAERRPLIVVDNVVSEDQVRLLLPGYGDAAVIVTSWTLIPGLGSSALRLQPLTDQEAVAMLGTVSNRSVTDEDRDTVLHVAHLLGNLPLALRIAGGLMRTRELWTWAKLADRLRAESATTDSRPLVIGSPEVQASFGLAYQELKPDTARGYRLLGLAPSARMSKELAQALISNDPDEADDVFDDLIAHQLLQAESESTFRMHDLLWLRARSLVTDEPDPKTRQAAIGRLTAWSLNQLRTRYLDQLMSSLRILPPLPRSNEPLSLPETYVDSELVAADSEDRIPFGRLVSTFPAKGNRLVLMAPGGSGKTTMIGYLCLLAAARYRDHVKTDSERIPLVVLIRDIRPGVTGEDLESLIISTLRYRYGCELTREALQVALEEGQVFIVADGLDELIEPVLRQRVTRSINHFTRRYSGVPVLVTTRPFARVRDAFPGFTAVTIEPWDKAGSGQYIEKLAATRRASAGIESLLSWLADQNDLGVIGTPLGLQLLASSYWYRNRIPKTFTLLMEDLIEEVSERRDVVRGISEEPRSQIRISSEIVAYAMQSSYDNRTAISRGDIERVLRSAEVAAIADAARYMARALTSARGGGFMRNIGIALDGEVLYAFPHTAYREHLAASHMARMDPDEILTIIRMHFTDPSWEAVFVSALELGSVWHGRRYPSEVLSAVGASEPVLYQVVHSWIKRATSGSGQ
jgi:hypothetical protein